MEETLASAVWILCVCSLGNVKPVDSTHFMGGLIRWRPVNPAAFDGRVREEAIQKTCPHSSVHGSMDSQFILSTGADPRGVKWVASHPPPGFNSSYS